MITFIITEIALIAILMMSVKSRSEYPINMLQLEGYRNSEYKNWIEENKDKMNKLVYKKAENEKTPLVWTDRVKRLMAVHVKVNLVRAIANGVAAFLVYFVTKNMLIGIATLAALLALQYLMQYKILMISNSAASKKEEEINMGFYVSAQNKIADYKKEHSLKVLGITGSFGKTSVKFISDTILSKKLRVKNTPSSFNTPMGLSKVINNELERDREVFIAELGAYKKGEIEEVATLVQPDIGIITAVGPTHMHLFKTIENIMNTKYELIESLPEDGTAIFNYDNEYVKVLADKTTKRTIRYGMEDLDKLDVYAKDVKVSDKGSTFTLGIKELGEIECESILLGKHNISNLLAAASAAYVLGLSLEEIQQGMKEVEPVEHRLNLIDSGTGVIVIDDAFNSNPVGFRAALDVLSSFENRRKIIITPGMVELGDMEVEENYKIGGEIAKVCDFAILVGIKRTEPIYKGLIDAGYEEDKIFRVKSLNDATETLSHISQAGDVVLFENDLPDNYNEE